MADQKRVTAIDPYEPCPCGSGKKFKWCCQPIHVQIAKAFEQDEQGQHEAALRMMDEVCAEHGGNPEVWGRKAQLLYQMGKDEEAENALQKAFDINPNYPFGYYLRGNFRFYEGELPGALLLFRKAAELYDPTAHMILASLYSLIAECELKLNRPVAARAALEIAAKHQPTDPNYKTGIEQLFGKESKLPEVARKQYSYEKPAAEASAARQQAWQRSLGAASTGKLTDAVKAFEQLTAEDADDPAAWCDLGLSKAWLGDNAGAVAALERSVELDKDEERAARAWALAEVLLCGYGMEEKANYVEHVAALQVRQPEQLVRAINDLQRQRRLLLNPPAKQDDDTLTGVLLEKTQSLVPNLGASQMPRVGAYLAIMGPMLRLWNVNKEAFDAALQEIRQACVGALGEPHVGTGPAHFAEVVGEGIALPIGISNEAEAKQKSDEFFQRFMEEKWIHRPLRSLGMVPPIDAAGHTTLRKKLRGVIYFLADCAAALGVPYNFDNVRRKLGLLGDKPVAGATPTRDFSAMSAAELAALDSAALNDNELEDVYHSAVKLAANDLAEKLALALVARPPQPSKADRYPIFNQLVQHALSEGNNDAALDYVDQGEKVDCEHNEGRRRNDYELRRGQVQMKRGDVDQAREVFERLIERAPTELRYRFTAAEAMLAAKQPAKALQFAEGGLKKSRELNNRDSEQYFMELAAAAKKQGA